MARTYSTVGTVVEELKIGNTRIKICNDAYINRTPEQIEQSKRRINEICNKIAMSDSYIPVNHDEIHNEGFPAQGT